MASFLAKDGQRLLPMLDLVEQAQLAIDAVIDVMGRATIEAVLQMSASQLAGPKQQGKKTDREVVYHGTQKGRVALKERQLRVEAGERLLKELAARNFTETDLLVVYIDGLQFGPYHVICAVGVDVQGHKHVLGFREGATENAEVAQALLEDLVRRGVDPNRRRLFVIDGSKALRKAINEVCCLHNPVQRCLDHKVRNVLGHLPKDQHDQARSTLKAAFKLDAKQGIGKLEQYAGWLERDWPSAAGSLREGLDELFTINRLGLPPALRRCLGTTNLIDNSHSAVREQTRRVKHWQSGAMALRWTAASFAASEKHFRRIMGCQHL